VLAGVPAAEALRPPRYVATARVLVPPRAEQTALFKLAPALGVTVSAARGSRLIVVENESADPSAAVAALSDALRAHAGDAIVIDAPRAAAKPLAFEGVVQAALVAAALSLFGACFLLGSRGTHIAKGMTQASHRNPPDRSAVRLALRLARYGQRTLLVDNGNGVRLVRIDEAAAGPKLDYVAALVGGALILARQSALPDLARRGAAWTNVPISRRR
jgi:hypothetical protein